MSCATLGRRTYLSAYVRRSHRPESFSPPCLGSARPEAGNVVVVVPEPLPSCLSPSPHSPGLRSITLFSFLCLSDVREPHVVTCR